jgi:hypothetical protein
LGNNCCGEDSESRLKFEQMTEWIQSEWLPETSGDHTILVSTRAVVNGTVFARYQPEFALPQDYRFVAVTQIECPVIAPLEHLNWEGEHSYRAGAFVYRFASGETMQEVVVTAAHTDRIALSRNIIILAAVPDTFIPVWHAFTRECDRINNARKPNKQVIIIGGHQHAFAPTVEWDDIVLPEKLAQDIRHDVESFFTKGVEIYQRLNLKPFRKLLFAGVPGTGKTMLCSALAKWALEQQYIVIYVSGTRKHPSDDEPAAFTKIQEAIDIAADSVVPTLIIVEELDAFLHEEQKAQVLNVLDGNESGINPKGTLLIATTNYPEAIDERVLKRPGRLDRIFIIPEVRSEVDAEKMLRQYLGSMWQDAHRALVPRLAGYPGAFIREVALYALMQTASSDLTDLPLDMLENSYSSLKEQISARDEFLKKRAPLGLPLPNGASSN